MKFSYVGFGPVDPASEDSTQGVLGKMTGVRQLRMELVGAFVWRCRLNPHLAKTERKFAKSNYDWRMMMKRILEFTATGKQGV